MKHRRTFTPQQAIILILAGLFVLAWIAFAAFFVFSLRAAAAPAVPSEVQPAQPAATAAPETAKAGAALPTAPAGCAQQGQSVQLGTAAGIVEPGVLEVRLDGTAYPVSLAGVDLPPDDSQRERLSQVMQEIAGGQPVLLVQDAASQDAPGKLVRYVFVGGQFLNDILIRQGLAQAGPDAANLACSAQLLQAEAQARTARAGLWQPSPVPTSTFMPFVTLDPANQAACDCSKDYTCADFTSQAEAQTCYNACNDYDSKLDFDRDGKACETLP